MRYAVISDNKQMRYAVISDIHSNKQALNAVLKDIDMLGADKIVCLGDIIGYGPAPMEVIDLLRNKVDHFLLGNHDAVAAGYINADNFNLSAGKVIEWTLNQIDNESIQFLRNIPLLLIGNNIRFTHGEFENPGRFGYIDDEASALATFNSCSESLMMAGHSHVPGIFVIGNSGVPHWLKPQNFGFEENKRYIVNVGSVGQPRDNDNRASYCIIDDEVNDVLFRKVEFDIASYKKELEKNALPAVSGFLFIDKTVPPSTTLPTTAKSAETSDFTPLSEADTVKIKKEVENLQQTVTKLQRSRKKLITLIFMLAVALIAVPATLISRKIPQSQGADLYTVAARLSTTPPGTLKLMQSHNELITMPEKIGVVSKKSPLKLWNIALTDPENQKIEIVEITNSKKKKMTAFSIKSDIQAPVIISSFAVPAKKGMRFSVAASIKKLNFNTGLIEIILKQRCPDGTEKIIMSKEPRVTSKKGSWVFTSMTMPKEAPLMRDGTLIFIIRGVFKGKVLVSKCSLKSK